MDIFMTILAIVYFIVAAGMLIISGNIAGAITMIVCGFLLLGAARYFHNKDKKFREEWEDKQ